MAKKTKSDQFAITLKKAINNQQFRYGSMIPSERELSTLYGLSRETVRKSIEILIQDSYLQKSKNRGTYVIKNICENLSINFKGMSELLKNAGKKPETIIIASEVCKAGFSLSKTLNIPEACEVFRIMRLRLGDGKPIAIEDTYIPYELIPHIDKIDFQIFSLYDILSSYSIQIDRINHLISSTKVRNTEARLLQLNDGDSVISIQLSSYTKKNQVVEHTKVVVISDCSSFYTDSFFHNNEVSVYAQNN